MPYKERKEFAKYRRRLRIRRLLRRSEERERELRERQYPRAHPWRKAPAVKRDAR